MAGSSEPVETPKLGIKATIAGLVFALAVLVGFGISTAAAVDFDDDHGEEHSDSHDDAEHDDADHEQEHGDDGE
jgi:hypothetical protein